jgi:hypothetical protein
MKLSAQRGSGQPQQGFSMLPQCRKLHVHGYGQASARVLVRCGFGVYLSVGEVQQVRAGLVTP